MYVTWSGMVHSLKIALVVTLAKSHRLQPCGEFGGGAQTPPNIECNTHSFILVTSLQCAIRQLDTSARLVGSRRSLVLSQPQRADAVFKSAPPRRPPCSRALMRAMAARSPEQVSLNASQSTTSRLIRPRCAL